MKMKKEPKTRQRQDRYSKKESRNKIYLSPPPTYSRGIGSGGFPLGMVLGSITQNTYHHLTVTL